MTTKFEIITADWTLHNKILKEIRKTVFIEEQSVPVALEWDEFDNSSSHFLVSSNHQYIATGRLKPDGQIGRMAVLKPYRRLGIGSALLDTMLEQAKTSELNKVYCHAQVAVINFYLNKGFEPFGEEFEDANIPHQAMSKKLCY